MRRLSAFRGVCRGIGLWLFVCTLFAARLQSASAPDQSGFKTWAVRLAEGASIEALAERVGASSWRPVGSLPDTYVLVFAAARLNFVRDSEGAVDIGEWITSNPEVKWEREQEGRVRVTRSTPTSEPLFPDQWHLRNTGQWGGLYSVDVNVEGAWALGYRGRGVGVAVVDSGTEIGHPDLQPNFVRGRDQWDDDNDPNPENAEENHGTAVAGIILAAANGRDGVGIAPEAGLYAMRLLGSAGAILDSDEADALGSWPDEVFVSNNSWGPSDSGGVSLASVGPLVRNTFEHAKTARDGKGTIFVWAAGNGRVSEQRADYDAYASAIQTIAVGAIGQDGRVTESSEPGACVFVAAPSLGAGRGILTTDRVGALGYSDGEMASNFSGTSAAAPMVSGVVALMLEANPELSWRDVQHIIARTAVRTDFESAGWFENSAGFHLNEDYGFGRIDALAAVRLAQRWTPVGAAIERAQTSAVGVAIPDNGSVLRDLSIAGSLTVEHVEVTLTLTHRLWKQLEIAVISPSGTRSVLSRPFTRQDEDFEFETYTFMTVQMWGESGAGIWQVEVTDTEAGTSGYLSAVSLRVHGTAESFGAAPELRRAEIAVDRWPRQMNAADWIKPIGGERLEVISAVPLRAGTVRFAENELGFEPPVDTFGRFPLSVCVVTGSGEARTFLVELVRPWIATDGLAPAAVSELWTTANILGLPAHGTLEDAGSALVYFPDPDVVNFRGVDRFSLCPLYREASVSIPVLYERDWSFETNGDDAYVDLGMKSRSLNKEFTVEGWIRPDGWGEGEWGFGRIFDKNTFLIFLNGYHSSNYNDASLVVGADFTNGDSVYFNTGPNSIVLNKWIHVAVTFDYLRSEPIKVYFDGKRVVISESFEQALPPAGTALVANSGDSALVGESAAGTRAFRGGFRDLRVWSEALEAEDIEEAAEGALPEEGDDLLVRLRARELGATSAVLEGALGETAFFYGMRWKPAQSPWASWRAAWPEFSDLGSGWSAVPQLGNVFGDHFPWVYHEQLGWLWSHFDGEAESQWFYRYGAHAEWLYWTRDNLPWMYSASRKAWLYYVADSEWFYDSSLRQWLKLP